jgi:hypothetical protein
MLDAGDYAFARVGQCAIQVEQNVHARTLSPNVQLSGRAPPLESATRAHNEMERSRRRYDIARRSAATACSSKPLRGS